MEAIAGRLSGIDSTLIPERVDFGQIVYPPAATFGPRRQTVVQLMIVYRGSADIVIGDDDRLHLGENEVGLLRPGQVEHFSFAADRETHHGWVHLRYGTRAALPDMIHRLPACLPLLPPLRSLMEAALAMAPPHHELRAGHARLLAAAMLYAYAEAATSDVGRAPAGSSRSPGPPPAIERARRYLHEHLGEPMQLSHLAAAANVTPSHLVRLFRQHLDVTPMRYLWTVRARRGVELLRDTGLSVSEIAYRVGCQSPYHFSRLVRRHAGESPTALRKRLWAASER